MATLKDLKAQFVTVGARWLDAYEALNQPGSDAKNVIETLAAYQEMAVRAHQISSELLLTLRGDEKPAYKVETLDTEKAYRAYSRPGLTDAIKEILHQSPPVVTWRIVEDYDDGRMVAGDLSFDLSLKAALQPETDELETLYYMARRAYSEAIRASARSNNANAMALLVMDEYRVACEEAGVVALPIDEPPQKPTAPAPAPSPEQWDEEAWLETATLDDIEDHQLSMDIAVQAAELPKPPTSEQPPATLPAPAPAPDAVKQLVRDELSQAEYHLADYYMHMAPNDNNKAPAVVEALIRAMRHMVSLL